MMQANRYSVHLIDTGYYVVRDNETGDNIGVYDNVDDAIAYRAWLTGQDI